ncbi:hypothetical protein JZ751_011169 [Albula glossodonta]|uniref:Uncharacterized protein n=1 Tax=Albula glossodonta TaxID=121402 RepID=A0A8T2NWE7_9TELE|nr:hypothetical protein JZ751_011169 [Albula glossodonta]
MSCCVILKTQLVSIMDVLAKEAVEEMIKFLDKANEGSSALQSVEITCCLTESEAPKKKSQQRMGCELMKKQITSIMEKLTKEALDKLGNLLHQEISRGQDEKDAPKRKLQLMESGLRTERGHGEGRAPESSAHRHSHSVGVQAGNEFTAECVPEEEHPPVSLWGDGEHMVVEEEENPLQSVIMNDKSPVPMQRRDFPIKINSLRRNMMYSSSPQTAYRKRIHSPWLQN